MRKCFFPTMSLRTRATAITLAITTLSLAVVAAMSLMQIRQQIDEEQHRTADAVALGVSRASELAMTVHDRRELTRLAASFLRDENILFIAVQSERGQTLAKAIRDQAVWAMFVGGVMDTERCVVGARVIETSGANESASEEVVDSPGALNGSGGRPKSPQLKNRGRVIVGISTGHSMVARRQQSRLTIVAAILVGAVGSSVLFLSLRPWMRRLKEVATASDAISRGDFTRFIGDHRDDEIGRLAQSFDTMSAALCERDRELRRFTDTLQDQVKERTKALELALKTAEDANRAKSLFLANMSHELRTPLNGVIGMVDLLLAAQPNVQQRRYCDIAKASARSLLELINDILDFSKIEAGKLDLDATDFNLHDVIEGVTQIVGERAEKKKLELACGVAAEVPRIVSGDAMRLRQVIVNLVSNAIKFTERGEVVIHAVLEDQTETHAVVRFSVKDSGIGISSDRINRLFKSFSQVDASTTRRFGGTGLGLAISQRLVELMGGTIGVLSEEGKGSTFWFTARFEKRADLPTSHRKIAADPRGLRVLAVDDNLTNREILHAQLESWSLRADIAADAAQALTMLRSAAIAGEPYRFAILDMHMPETDGMQLARLIKADPLTQSIILISLSSISDPVKPREMSDLGFSACLTKPALPSQLYNAIVDSLSNETQGQRAPDTTERTPDGRLDGVRVLLAEDNEVNQLVASELLNQVGCRCTIASNGRQAVEEALRGEFDVILMDCQMPELDGFEATREIREAEKAAGNGKETALRRPIIALTANAIKGDRELCLAAGMDGYVTKPIDPIELFQTIRALVPVDGSKRLGVQIPTEVETLQSRESEAASSTPPIDLELLKRRCMGNRKLAAKVLDKFDSSMIRELPMLLGNIQNGDIKSVAALAHKIKGGAANVSAEQVRRIADELEALAKSDSLSQAQDCIGQLELEMQRFRDYLATAQAHLVPPELTTPAHKSNLNS